MKILNQLHRMSQPSTALGGQEQGPSSGLATLLDTTDFSCWEATLARQLGHHRSTLLAGTGRFEARIRAGRLGMVDVLHLQGRGALRLLREQCEAAVLWLPLQGISQETINGVDWLAEPGMGLLYRPGDAMDGRTSRELEGLSIVIPASELPPISPGAPALLHAGVACQRLLECARQLAAVVAARPPGAEHGAAAFMEALRQWCLSHDPAMPRQRVTAVRRRRTVAEAREWLQVHHREPFNVLELAEAMQVSVRTLQYSFRSELGCTPQAELKRLRLGRLRQLLLDPDRQRQPVAELMLEAGLVACGATAAEYRRWCGELPRQTRRN